MNNSYNKTRTNLIGEITHQNFLELQASVGIVQRGGVYLKNVSQKHQERLVSDINILDASETRKLIFSEAIFNN